MKLSQTYKFAVMAIFLLTAVFRTGAVAQAASNPVVDAARRTIDARSSKLRISATTVGGGLRATMTGSGTQKGGSIALSMRARTAGQSTTIDAVMLKEGGRYVMYMRSPAFAAQLPAGKRWIKIDLSQASTGGIDIASLVDSSQTLAPLEKGLVSTKRLGRETVAGQPTNDVVLMWCFLCFT